MNFNFDKRMLWSAGSISIILILLMVWAGWGSKDLKTRQGVSPVSSGAVIPVKVLDVSERLFDNKPAIAVLFATELNPRSRYDRYLSVNEVQKDTLTPVKGAWVLSDNRRTLYFPHVKPEVAYQVRVERELPAANGTLLNDVTELKLTTRKITPGIGFASRGSILPGRLSDGLPIVSINVPEVDLQFLRVAPESISQFLTSFRDRGSDQMREHELDRLHKIATSVYSNRFRTLGKENQRTVTHIPVHDISELRQPGLYIAVLTEPGRFTYSSLNSFFLVTDIGLHARVYADGVRVHAASLRSSKPLTGLKLKLVNNLNKTLEETVTNAQGIGTFSQKPNNTMIVLAERDREISALSFNDAGLDLSEFDTTGPKQSATEAFVYAGRDLYRPGDAADFSILLRDYDGKATSALPLTVMIKQPDGRTFKQYPLNPYLQNSDHKFGYYQTRLQLPQDAQTGKWTLEVSIAGSAVVSQHRFNVEEFLPERMKLDLKTESHALSFKDAFDVKIIGAYLYGAPTSGNRVTAVLNRYPDYHPLEQYKTFFFGDIQEEKERAREEILDAKLNAKGEHQLRLNAIDKQYNSPMAMAVTSSVYESGGRPVTRSVKRVVWPSDALVGVKPLYSGKFAPENSMVDYEVIKASNDGKLRGTTNLQVQLIREDRNYFWSYSTSQGWHYEHTETPYPVHLQSLVIPDAGRAKISLPVEWGSYRLEITDPDTQRVMRHRFQAGWDSQSRSQAKNARPDKINMTLDKKSYQAGDKLNVQLVAPHAGRGYVLVESDKVLWSQAITLPAEGAKLEINIAKEWEGLHNLYISAVIFRPGDQQDKITPNRSVGLAHISFARDDRRLSVKLDAPAKMQPERKLRTTVKVAGLSNQPAMVTISAVDQGILNITNFKSPDPNNYFFAKRAYAIDQFDLYSRVIENLHGVRAKLRFGGDGMVNQGQSGKKDRAKVKTVALFSGPVNLNAQGEAVVELEVPDFNGSLRLMAVAFTADRYGAAEAETIVAAPVIAEISTPRFITANDQSTLALDLHNLSGQEQSLAVGLNVSSPLKLNPVQQTVKLKDQEKTTLRFPLGGDLGFGVGEIKLTVKGQNVAIRRSWELGVRPAYPPTRNIHYQVLKAGENYTLQPQWIADFMPETVDGTLTVSAVPPLNIRSAIKGLLAYPYGCLEQTTSRAFPLVYIDEAKARELGLTPFTLAQRADMIDQAIAQLRAKQKVSGGFGLWDSNAPEEPWLTPYVLDFLLEARKQGFTVPDALLETGLKNLQTVMGNRASGFNQQYWTNEVDHLRFAADAYAAYVLAKTGKASLGTLRTLFDSHRNGDKTGLPRVQLGIALKLQGDLQRGDKAITEGIELLRKSRDQWHWYGDYGSTVRDVALAYALLTRHGFSNDKSDALLFDLSKMVASKSYLSTQEQLALYLAFQGAEQQAGGEVRAELIQNKTSTALNAPRRVFRTVNASELLSGIQVNSRSDRTLYVSFDLSGYTKQAPKLENKHIEVVRTLYDMKGQRLERTQFKVGELVIAHVAVRAKDEIKNGLLVDLLPAGFEIENLNITQGEQLDAVRIQGINPKESMRNDAIVHQEYRDDRFAAAIRVRAQQSLDLFYLIRVVSPGIYQVPPSFAEDMYNPEYRGISATAKPIEVLNAGF